MTEYQFIKLACIESNDDFCMSLGFAEPTQGEQEKTVVPEWGLDNVARR